MPIPPLHFILLLFLLITTAAATSKTLSQNCYCDVTTSCDDYCCCDAECSSQAVTYWNNYYLCANDGFAIPFCSAYVSQPLHVHDLSQGLRLIYTVTKRLFCISKVNFANPSSNYQTTSTDQQLPPASTTVTGVNQLVLDLTAVSTYSALPLADGLGRCAASPLRDMNSIKSGTCSVYVAATGSIGSNQYLNPSSFCTSNNLDPTKLKTYLLTSNSISSSSTVSALNISFACTASGSTNVCNVIRQIKLFFIKGTTTTVDYDTSYLVVGSAYVNSGSFVTLRYGYQFQAQSKDFEYASTKGYQLGSPLNLLLSTTTTTTTYSKVFNPLNLAFKKLDGTCGSTIADAGGQNNLLELSFGVNSVYSCMGTTSILAANIQASFNYVGSLGISSINLKDYVKVAVASNINSNQNLQLVFYYIPIGTNMAPEYQILQVELNPLGNTNTGLPTSLFVEYQTVSSSVFMNVPSPPVIDAYLPDDFLYPFYVA